MSKIEFQMKNNIFYPGDDIEFSVTTDNEQCHKAVESLTFKLVRFLKRKDKESGDFIGQQNILLS